MSWPNESTNLALDPKFPHNMQSIERLLYARVGELILMIRDDRLTLDLTCANSHGTMVCQLGNVVHVTLDLSNRC